jgi:hypothetical protein
VDSLLRIARKERSGLTRKASDDGGIEMSDISYGSKKGRRGGQDESGVEVEMTRFRRGDDEDDDDDDMEMPDIDQNDDEEEVEESSGGLLNSGDQKSILEILAK